jgi:hypothetical protein
MTSHIGLMVLFAAFVSTVFGTLLRESLPDQVRFAVRAFLALVGGAYLTGWLMYLIFG